MKSIFFRCCQILAATISLSGCDYPVGLGDWGDNTGYTGPVGQNPPTQVITRAVIGVPWETVDFRFKSDDWGYAAVLKPGDSITLFYVQKSGDSPIPVRDLNVVPTENWSVSAQSMDKPGTTEAGVASIRADKASGGAVLKIEKAGFWVYPKPEVGVVFYENYLYSCRANECVKVYLAVPKG